ncbi:hypothetical protein ACERNI_16510 [Camelimonas sp. ID_303_24]
MLARAKIRFWNCLKPASSPHGRALDYLIGVMLVSIPCQGMHVLATSQGQNVRGQGVFLCVLIPERFCRQHCGPDFTPDPGTARHDAEDAADLYRQAGFGGR